MLYFIAILIVVCVVLGMSGIIKGKLLNLLNPYPVPRPRRRRLSDTDREPGSPFVCVGCGKAYNYQRSLSLHQRLECGKEPRFQCPYCSKRCHQRGNINIHIRKYHLENCVPTSNSNLN